MVWSFCPPTVLVCSSYLEFELVMVPSIFPLTLCGDDDVKHVSMSTDDGKAAPLYKRLICGVTTVKKVQVFLHFPSAGQTFVTGTTCINVASE